MMTGEGLGKVIVDALLSGANVPASVKNTMVKSWAKIGGAIVTYIQQNADVIQTGVEFREVTVQREKIAGLEGDSVGYETTTEDVPFAISKIF